MTIVPLLHQKVKLAEYYKTAKTSSLFSWTVLVAICPPSNTALIICQFIRPFVAFRFCLFFVRSGCYRIQKK